MPNVEMVIRPYLPEDEDAVVELWRKYDRLRSWNNANLDIERKLKVNPELFLVGVVKDKLVAAVMGGMTDIVAGYITWLLIRPIKEEAFAGRL